jgi:DNA invertase Pin-like site-specific DNA recombinase
MVVMVRAGIYIRISKTKRELLDAQRQEPPCRAFCAAQGWTVVEVYIDDGRSAWRQGVRRDNFERMLVDVRAGKIDAIVSWQMDRLLRRVEDAAALLAIARQFGTTIANVDGALDLTTASGRKKFHNAAVAAEYSSDLSSERLRLKHAELAADGKFSGGGRPFGYDLDEYVYQDHAGRHIKYRLVKNPTEAEVIAKAAQEVIDDGRSVTSVVKEWAAGNVRSTRGRLFRYGDVKELLVSSRIAGLRDADGKLVDAEWDGIITREQHKELTSILGSPRRRGSNQGTARSYLLAGFVYCACGTRLRSHKSKATREAEPRRRYVCDRRDGGCGGVKRLAEVVEGHVVRRLLLELPGRLLEAARRAPEEWKTLGRLMTQRQTEEDRLEGFADFLADGAWDKPTYVRQVRRVKARIAELDDKINHVRASTPRRCLNGATLGELQAEWEQLDLEEQRAVLADHIERVVVKRVGPGRRQFDPDSIQIHWR